MAPSCFWRLRESASRSQGGDPASREALQDLGQSLVDADAEGFVRVVLRSAGFTAGDNLIVDGVRHVDIQTLIAKLVYPSRAFLIHLAVDDANAYARTEGRRQGRAEIVWCNSFLLGQNSRNLSDAGCRCINQDAWRIELEFRHATPPATFSRLARSRRKRCQRQDTNHIDRVSVRLSRTRVKHRQRD